METMKKVNHMLGIKVKKVEEGIWISQTAYTNRMLEKFGMINCKPRSILLPVRFFLLSNDGLDTKEGKKEIKGVPYQEALGLLMWLQVATRPDLSFAINLLSCYAGNPGRAHWEVMKYRIAYVKGTAEYRITYYCGSSLQPVGFTDLDFTNDKDTQCLTNGHVFYVGGPVSWSTEC